MYKRQVERLVQFLNAQKFIFVSVLGRLTIVSEVQPRNALEPISAMPLGTIIVFKFLLNEKQLLSMPTDVYKRQVISGLAPS